MTSEQALTRLQNLCSRSEKCMSDLRKKLTAWEIPAAEATKIVARLQADGFVDDRRYAKAFVRDKSRLSRWGILKIRNALKNKQIEDAIIKEALTEVDSLTVQNNLVYLLQQKKKSLKAIQPIEQREKLLRFALSRGYSYNEALVIIDKLIRNS